MALRLKLGKKPASVVEGIEINQESRTRSVRISWKDLTGAVRSHQFDLGQLAEPRLLRRELLSKGFLPLDREAQSTVFEALLKDVDLALRDPSRIVRVTGQIGWTDDFSTFVLPDRTIPKKHKVRFASPTLEHLIQSAVKGDLADWKREVAGPARCSSRFALAISAAFAAPCLRLMDRPIPTFGINFSGGSSIGKSTALRLAQSVFGFGELRGFVVSKRALEQLARGHRDAPLSFDEPNALVGSSRATAIREMTYFLSGGMADAVDRNYRAARGERAEAWRLVWVCSSEGGLYADRLEGEHARLLDVPAPKSEFGLIDNLPIAEKESSSTKRGAARDLIVGLNAAVQNFHGSAFRAFLYGISADSLSAKTGFQNPSLFSGTGTQPRNSMHSKVGRSTHLQHAMPLHGSL